MLGTFFILVVALLVGCEIHSGLVFVLPQQQETESRSLTKPPREFLETVAKVYDTKSESWSQHISSLDPNTHPVFSYALNELISHGKLSEAQTKIARDALSRSTPRQLDGASVLKLLETCGYADVMCEFGEYPIRISTLEYIKSQIEFPAVRAALRRIASEYKCKLPDGGFGLLSAAMETRVPKYATRLLREYKRDGK